MEYHRALARLWEVGLNPRHLARDLGEYSCMHRLTPEMIEAFMNYLRARRRLMGCIYRSYVYGLA